MQRSNLNVQTSQSREKRKLQMKHSSVLAGLPKQKPVGRSDTKGNLHIAQKKGRFQIKMLAR